MSVMRIVLLCCACVGCTSAPVREPTTPSPPPARVEPEPVGPQVSRAGEVSRAEGVVALSGMIVATRVRAERTVTALALEIEAAPGAGWFDLRVRPEVSDDAGLDYLRCHDVKLRADTSFGDASQRDGDAWWLPLTVRHEVDGAQERVTARVWRGWVEHLAEAGETGGRICEDDFVLEAAHKAKLRELLTALGPMEAGWSESAPPVVIEVGGRPSAR